MIKKYNTTIRSRKFAAAIFFAAAGALVAAVPASAETLTIALPDAEAKDGALVLSGKNGKIAEFKASAYAQVQYLYASSSGNGSDNNGFTLRRTDIALSAKIDEVWSGAVAFEFDSKNSGGVADNGYIEYAYIGYTTDAGTLKVGQLKPHFLQEEITSCLKLPAIERSIATNYLSSTGADVRGLSAAHIGIFWDGKFSKNTLYGISLTNAVGQDYDARSNALSVTAYAETAVDFDQKTKAVFGLSGVVNFGNDGATPTEIANGTEKSTPLTNAGTVYGIEPYVKISSGGLNVLLDGYYVNGNESSHVSDTLAAIGIVSYRFENGIEPVARIARLRAKTQDGGVRANYQANVPATAEHTNAVTYYAGANYYVNEHVKISAGYEYGRYFGAGKSEDSNALRAQFQVAF